MNKIFIAAFLVICKTAAASPFDVDMGTSLATLEKSSKGKIVDENVYASSTPPGAHPDFDDYRFIFTSKQGVCKTIAWTPLIPTSSFGNEVKSRFEPLAESLTRKYGKPLFQNDFVQKGSIWREPQDWTMGLVKKERFLSAGWQVKNSPDHITSISLEAVGHSREKAMIQITYQFENFDKCRQEMLSKQDSKL